MRYPKHVSESVRRLNPSLFPVGASGPVERKRRAKSTLVKNAQGKQADSPRVLVRCTIIVCRNRVADSDNAIAGGTKALRDAIARWLFVDDADPRIQWEYGQVHTSGEEGCIVKLELL
jgi:hypothetical protein